jgi:gliding motility-associated lipoprotein GldH
MISIFNKYLLLITTLIVLVSCGGGSIYFEENKSITNKDWAVDNKQEFDFTINDTTQLYDFFFNVRTTSNYEYSNMYIFYKLYFPNGKSLSDTAQFILADPTGKWLGKTVSGSLIDNSILFSNKRRFPLSGKYTFLVQHGMRNNKLSNISDVGFKIKEHKEK